MNTMLQVEEEIAGFAAILQREGVRSYLEVGSKFGGSLRRAAEMLPKGSRIVSIDLPNGTKAWSESRNSLTALMGELKALGHDTHLIWGDSTAPDIIAKVKALGPFDACFIDANHTLPFVEKDWANYGQISRIVAFHDISWRRAPDWVGCKIDVPQFWERIKGEFRHEELRFCPTGKNNGIGVLWR